MANKPRKISIDKLVPNQDWQTRHRLDEENVQRLQQAMRDGVMLPPILVRPIPGANPPRYEVFDGFHRLQAAKNEGNVKSLPAEIHEGDEHAALTEGVTRNLSHGLQLIHEDMKRAAKMLHKPDIKGGNGIEPGSYTWVGQILGVHGETVRSWLKPRRKERERKRHAAVQSAAKLVKEVGEEGLKERLLERWGASALDKSYEPVVEWSTKHKAGSPGIPVLMISDIHYGEVVNPEEIYHSNTFDREICRHRLRHTFETAAGLLKTHFAKPDYPGIVLVLGGDMISGSLHDDQMATDEVAPVAQSYEIAKLVADGVAFLSGEFKRVDVYCVAGNHGRTTRKPRAKFYAHNNLDWLSYKMLGDYVSGRKNVTVNAPNARDLTFVVAGHRYRLTHGDQFRGGDGIIGPLGPIIRGDVRKRVTASLMPGQPEAYDTMLCGHFHQLLMLPRLIVNGSVKGYDEYAMGINVPWEPPQQALWTVHATHGHTWYMPVLCDPDYRAHGLRE